VVMIEDMPRLRYLRLAPTVFSGRHVRQRAVRVVRSHEVRISASRPFTLYADGEAIAELPVVIRVLPGAIRMIVPA
jgi:diacylglycerol kinase family enzyme